MNMSPPPPIIELATPLAGIISGSEKPIFLGTFDRNIDTGHIGWKYFKPEMSVGFKSVQKHRIF